MSKKRGSGGGHLGRALVKDRNKSRRGKVSETWLHSCEAVEDNSWNPLNYRSVTEESRLEEFLATAELAGTEFTAERLNIRVIEPLSVLPSAEESAVRQQIQDEHRSLLTIPRRPKWDASTTASELDLRERDEFLSWRRGMAKMQEEEQLILTPFERNLEFWRQLWRVVEKSDIVVQIVDARNPLLFRCEDLEKYVCEVDPEKVNMILISKADLLTAEQREMWTEYFSQHGNEIVVAFWSSLLEQDAMCLEAHQLTVDSEVAKNGSCHDSTMVTSDSDMCSQPMDSTCEGRPSADCGTSQLLSSAELLELFQSISPVGAGKLTTVGLVGYPNVGKSSTINTLFKAKKVPVSHTPGRTKHFQTLYITDQLMLCDCPGLVFPNFLSSKAEMVCSGVLPIDQLRDHTPPVSLVCQRIPRACLEATYGICLPNPQEGEDPKRPPHAHELLSAYGYVRGFMTSHGLPDEPRTARYILKDYVNGRLLYCHAPPGGDTTTFNTLGFQRHPTSNASGSDVMATTGQVAGKITQGFDKQYFEDEVTETNGGGGTRVFVKNLTARSGRGGHPPAQGKEWKKHFNRNKKEKTRRLVSSH